MLDDAAASSVGTIGVGGDDAASPADSVGVHGGDVASAGTAGT